MTPEQAQALKRQADAQRQAAAQALEQAKQQGLTGKTKLEHIAQAIAQAAQDAMSK